MTQVLLAEDDPAIAEPLARALAREGYDVLVQGTGQGAVDHAGAADLVVLDLGLPDMDGLEVCRKARDNGFSGAIMIVTARAGELDRVVGLDYGADDYMSKPVRFPELVARIRALARRAGPARPAVLERGDLTLDPASRVVTRAGREIELSPKEFGVLEVLMGADGRAVSSEELLERVWDENLDPFSTTVRMTVMKLRRKLGDPAVLDTVPGAGYRL